MSVKATTTEFGHSLLPEAPHAITFDIPGWDTASKRIMASISHNEFLAANAEALLGNSNNCLARSAILNCNAGATPDHSAVQAAGPDSPIRQVLHPSASNTLGMRHS